MVSGHPLSTLLHERCTANRSHAQCLHGDVHVQMLYTCMHFHFRVPIKISVTLSEHCISQSARFKNTVIELLKTSTDPQISRGVDALKQLFLRKKDARTKRNTLKKSTCYNLSKLHGPFNYELPS